MLKSKLKVHSISPELSWRLDMARALAALSVLFGHVRNDYFVAYGDLLPDYHHFFNFFLFFITRLGHEAVMIFFVLSGFLVGGNALKDWLNGSFRLADYFTNRITRLWVVVIPALFIGAGANLIRSCYFDMEVDNFTVSTFVGNLFFIQTVFVPTFGGNPPLWSLANEFWYYCLWPIVLSFFTENNIKRGIAIVVIIGSGFIAPEIMKLFPLWVFGAILRVVPFVRIPKRCFPIFVLLLTVAVGYCSWKSNIVGEYATGLMFGAIVLFWMFSESTHETLLSGLWKWLAAFSFSLYTIHFPLIQLLVLLLNKYAELGARNVSAGIYNWICFMGICLFLLLCGRLFYYLFEAHTDLVRTLIKKRIQNFYGLRRLPKAIP